MMARGHRDVLRWGQAFLLSLAVGVGGLILPACSGSLEFADWSVEVPGGTRIIEYPVVPVEDRSERIELVEDLVIGQRGDDPDYIFYRPRGVVADSAGRLFVLDAGNNRVQVFDAEGEYLRTLGGEGQGPGELSQPFGIAIAADHVVVHDFRNAKLVVWSLDGEHLGDPRFAEGRGPSGIVGLAGGTLVGRTRTTDQDEGRGLSLSYELSILSQEAERLLSLQDFPRFEPLAIERELPGGGVIINTIGAPSPVVTYAATPGGDIYSTFCAEYQVHALTSAGDMRWAMRVPWVREPFTREDIDVLMEEMREFIQDADASEIEWPEQFPALDRLEVDGRGRLYVFPYYKPEDGDEQPVDVYSRDGERLFSGWIPRTSWDFALGDYVYGRESDDETGEVHIIRYRLVWPES